MSLTNVRRQYLSVEGSSEQKGGGRINYLSRSCIYIIYCLLPSYTVIYKLACCSTFCLICAILIVSILLFNNTRDSIFWCGFLPICIFSFNCENLSSVYFYNKSLRDSRTGKNADGPGVLKFIPVTTTKD